MSKIIIKTPATSANLGTGFDFVGLALSRYNEIQIEALNDGKALIEEFGFDNVGDNLVRKCFEDTIKKYSILNKHYIITLLKNDIPVARGLGSSASAIVSGVCGANYFLDKKINEEELINIMVSYEGHPDNILPCYFGGLVSSIKDEKLYYFKHEVNDELRFFVLIPKYKVRTEEARKILPKSYSLEDVVFNSSRVMLMSKAFKDLDIELIKKVTDDRVHEPYRKTLIKEFDIIEKAIKGTNAKLNISGSGPTMLLISKDDIAINLIKELNLDLDIYNLKVSNGCIIKE